MLFKITKIMQQAGRRMASRTHVYLRAVLLSLLAVLVWPPAGLAQQDSQEKKACNLLTAAELSSVIGGSAGKAMSTFSPKNSQFGRNGDFWSCEWTVGTRTVWVFYDTLVATAEGKKLAQEQRDRYRKEGYQIKETELSGSRCVTTVPPGRAKNFERPPGTSCERDKAAYHILVSVETTSANDLVPIERVLALVDKAAARAPGQ